MQREEKSERSRRQVLDASLELFSHQGYRATSVREIAQAANVSTGNVYHHFPDKESIFRTLLDEYWEIVETQRYPFTRALSTGTFPDNLEQLGMAARASIRQYRQHVVLIYVDVIEFDGTHIRKFYGGMHQRFGKFLEEQQDQTAELERRLRPGVSPLSALMISTRMFFNYFQLEILFGVAEPFGKESNEVVREMADLLRKGMLQQ